MLFIRCNAERVQLKLALTALVLALRQQGIPGGVRPEYDAARALLDTLK